MNPFILQAAGIFGAGLLTSLSPCVYPMIPITVGYLGSSQARKSNQRLKIISFFIGQVIAFTALGVAAASLGEVLGFSSELPSVQLATGALLAIMACFSFSSKLPSFMNKWNQFKFFQSSINTDIGPLKASSQAILMGAISALVASPCTSPVLGGVLATIAQADDIFVGTFLMSLYATGMSLIFLFLGLGLVNVQKLPRAGNWLNRIHLVSSIILFVGGIYYISEAIRYW